MERLTVKNNEKHPLLTEYKYLATEKGTSITVLNKLGEYEDLEEQGRLIKLSCKVGDTVYHECPYSTWLVGVQSYQITNIMISQNKKGEWTRKYRAMLLRNGKTADKQINFEFNDIGKTVFPTKEEAEKALAEMEK